MIRQPLWRGVQVQLARTVADSGAPVRLAMRGTSMLPLFHEPYVLEVLPVREPLRIGDVVVFRRNNDHVAHRVVAFADGEVITSGDAQPHILEHVAFEDVLGRVDAVWSNALNARRVDRFGFRLRGLYFARMHRLRRAVTLAWRTLRSIRAPWNRERPFAKLYTVLRERFTAPRERFIADFCALPASALDLAVRHRCAGFLPADAPVPMRLRRAMLGSHISTMALARELDDVVSVLQRHAIPVVLLKGAARLYTGNEVMRAHPSADIDVLVPEELQEIAVDALLDAGYMQRGSYRRVQWYKIYHHHAAPLYRTGRRPVEVHRALAPAARFGTRTTWRDLAPHLIETGNEVYVLDAFAVALHTAMHAATSFSLRDAVFLAEVLRDMPESERRHVWAQVQNEPLDPVRLGGALAFACDLAGVPADATPLQQLYRRWMLRRDDLPVYLRNRAQAIDAAFLLCSSRPRQAWRALCMDTRGLPIAGRIVTGVIALLYASLMRDAP